MKKFMFFAVLLLVFGFSIKTFANPVEDTGGGDAIPVNYDASDDIANGDLPIDDTDSGSDTTNATAKITSDNFDNITSDNYVPNVSTESFFAKIHSKLFEVDNFFQKAVAIILIGIIIACLVKIVIAVFSKKNFGNALLALLICALCFFADIHIMDILGAFTSWLHN